ncbi:DNA primase [Helicobacter suis]|uniref:DNA primase n=1 Tax=Helicobacter suis TaxID=104628 RepID=UPI001E419DB1|nr:DNA primase [Helicobacter suis]
MITATLFDPLVKIKVLCATFQIMISQESLEQLKQVADIVEVVQSYIDLKRVGSNYRAICPFHDEKTPSFMINPSRNSFKCYGCSKAGNAITFVMEYEKLDFISAVQKLAHMFNLPLQYTTEQKQTLPSTDLLEKIAQCYQIQLKKHPLVLDYLKQRGLKEESIKAFNLGFCAPQSVLDFINQEKLDRQALLELGVLGEEDNKSFVRLKQRLIFPIHNPNGKMVGFGGRILQDNSGAAKYINSPQTVLFNKSKLLYGYFQAREAIFKTKQIILTEGYLDVILLQQAGFKTAVATLGTALTETHIPILNRGDPSVILLYDGDEAGYLAALRASKILSLELKRGGVVLLNNALDPADMITQGKSAELKALLQKPIPFIEFVLKGLVKPYSLSDALQKQKAFKEAQTFLHSLPQVLQEEYRPMAASLLKLPRNALTLKKNPLPQMQAAERLIKNPLEEILIKYMALHPELLTQAKNYIHPETFEHCAQEFNTLCLGEENVQILNIKLDNRLPTLSENFEQDFKAQLLLFIKRHCQRRIEETNHLNKELNPQERLEILVKWRTKLQQINKGELVQI